MECQRHHTESEQREVDFHTRGEAVPVRRDCRCKGHRSRLQLPHGGSSMSEVRTVTLTTEEISEILRVAATGDQV